MAQTEFMNNINRVNTAKINIKNALVSQGLTVGDNIEDYATLIGQITGGIKEYATETLMNNDIANISTGEVVKVTAGPKFFIKEIIESTPTMTELVKVTETITPEEYEENIDLADDILGLADPYIEAIKNLPDTDFNRVSNYVNSYNVYQDRTDEVNLASLNSNIKNQLAFYDEMEEENYWRNHCETEIADNFETIILAKSQTELQSGTRYVLCMFLLLDDTFDGNNLTTYGDVIHIMPSNVDACPKYAIDIGDYKFVPFYYYYTTENDRDTAYNNILTNINSITFTFKDTGED